MSELSRDAQRGSRAKPGGQPDEETDLTEEEKQLIREKSQEQQRLREEISPESLPLYERKEEVIDKLVEVYEGDGPAIMTLFAETGAGKSVLTPSFMFEALKKLDLPEKIAGTEPRIVASQEVAQAASAVIPDKKLGEDVCPVTSEDREVRDADFKVMTPKIFLSKLAEGQLSNDKVGGIIIDELHEGTKEYHMIMGLLKRMHETGEAPLTLLTSATMNEDQIVDFYDMDKDHYMEVEGRTYPVDTEYISKEQKKIRDRGYGGNYTEVAADKSEELVGSTEGDILIFMPGHGSIDDTKSRIEKKLERSGIHGVEVLPVSGSHDPENKHLARTGKGRDDINTRIVISTDMAESSLTIPDITAVIDSCRNKRPIYNSKTGIESLQEQRISKDNAEQRKGRAGRVQEGDYYPILTEDEFEILDEHPTPEIKRGNLENIVLNLKRILENWQDMDFDDFVENYLPDPPSYKKIEKTLDKLKTLGALDKEGNITQTGREMEKLPFDARISKIITEAKEKEPDNQENRLEKTSLVMGALSRSREDLVYRGEDGDVEEKHKRAGFYNSGGGSSDWIRDLNIIHKALQESKIADYIKNKSDHSAQQSTFKWCKQRSVHFSSLENTLTDLRQKYARQAGMRIDLDNLGKEVEKVIETRRDDLSEILLSAYPESVLKINNYNNIEMLDSGEEIEDFDDDSVASRTEVNLDLCITAKIFQPYSNKYAGKIHPVTIDQLKEVMPDKLEKSGASNVEIDPETSEIFEDTSYSYKQSRYRNVLLGRSREKISGENLADYLVESLLTGKHNFISSGERKNNEELYERISDLYQRTGGSISEEFDERFLSSLELGSNSNRSDLKTIYHTIIKSLPDIAPNINSLEELDSLEKVEETIDSIGVNPFVLQADWFLRPDSDLETLEELTKESYPDQIELNGEKVDVEYDYTSEDYTATLSIPEENILSLSEEDIDNLNIGEEEHKPELYFTSKNLDTYDDLQELQEVLIEKKRKEEWRNFDTPKYEEFPIPDEKLPDTFDEFLQQCDYETKKYGEVQNQEFFAYPSIKYDKYKKEAVVKYYQSKEQAEREYNSSKNRINNKIESRKKEQEEKERFEE